jgi:hypothetical protein
LLPAVSSASLNNAATSAPAPGRVLDTPNGNTPNGTTENASVAAAGIASDAVSDDAAQDEQLSPAEVEMRRARQLLDRSFTLSEHGDLPGAVLACRQAISLVPDLAEAHSMLGVLLERTGDTKGAIEAYEETLLLAPNSTLERESLQRLRAQMPQQGATPIFHFDDSELFSDAPPAASNEFMTPVADGTTTHGGADASTATEPESAGAIPASASGATHGIAPAVATGAVVAASAVAASAATARGASEFPGASTASSEAGALHAAAPATNTVGALAPSAYAPVAPVAGTAVPATPIDFGITPTEIRPNEPWWQAARSRPSFYLRALPLTGVALAGLMFMLWARNVADHRNDVATASYAGGVVANDGTGADTTARAANGDATTGTTPGAAGTPGAPGGITGSNVPITNDWRTVPPNAPAVPGTTTNTAAGGNSPGGSSPGSSTAPPSATSTRGGGTQAPRLPSIPPATIRPGSAGGAGPAGASGGSGAQPFDGIPPASILNTPAAPEVVQAVPSSPGDGGVTTSGGGPVNPGGSSRRGSIRVISRPSPSQAPTRPENAARGAEDAARDDAASGRTGQAISRATTAINTGNDFDRAYRLQQRALLRLDAGDNGGAITDFQAAISAYNDQISRGTRVAEARRGISSCQSGLRLAQANNRR